MAAFVKAYVESRQTPKSDVNPITELSNKALSDVAKTTVEQLEGIAGDWAAYDQNEDQKAYEIHYYSPSETQQTIDAVMANAEANKVERAKVYRGQAKDTLVFADQLRDQIMTRLLPPDKKKEQQQGDAPFKKLIANEYDLRQFEAAIKDLYALRIKIQ